MKTKATRMFLSQDPLPTDEEPFLIFANRYYLRKLNLDGSNYTLLKQVPKPKPSSRPPAARAQCRLCTYSHLGPWLSSSASPFSHIQRQTSFPRYTCAPAAADFSVSIPNPGPEQCRCFGL